MFSLKKLLGKDEKFFDLLEESATESRASTRRLQGYLKSLVKSSDKQSSIGGFAMGRLKDKRITQQITEELCKTFVTPLEREDIEALSTSLYKISKIVEKLAERISIYPGKLPLEGFLKQAELLEVASGEVVFMVGQLRKKGGLKVIKEANERVQYAEGEADKVMLKLLEALYRDPTYGAKETVILQEMFEMMEKAVDRCRDAGNVVFQIVLKYS